MYAIVEIKGQQFKAEEGKFLYVHHLGDEVKEGDSVSFDKVLLLDADGDVKVGVPAVEGAKVECEVLLPLVKGDKVLVFKKKRRKGYRRLKVVRTARPVTSSNVSVEQCIIPVSM